MTCFVGLFALVATLAQMNNSPHDQYEALVKEYDSARTAYIDGKNKSDNHVDRVELAKHQPQPRDYAPRFFALAEKYSSDPAAIDALTWVAAHCAFMPQGEKALQELGEKHSDSARIAAYVGNAHRYGEPFAPYEEFLRTVLARNTHRNVRASACISLATYLKMAKEKSESNLIRVAIRGERSLLPQTLSNLNRLKAHGLDKVGAESEALFERAIEEYGDARLLENYPQEAEEFAKEQLFALRKLSIGSQSLNFESQDISGNAIKLSDFRGQIVVLDFGSHKACGICRAMYPQLRRLVEQFQKEPVAFIGVNAFDDLHELKRLASDLEITWRVVLDGDSEQGPIGLQWVIRSMPTIYILDHTGVIRNKGFLEPDEISGTVEMLLKEVPARATSG